MVAGAALMVSACGGNDTSTSTLTVVTDINTTDLGEGTVTDNVTPLDATGGNGTMMGNDSMMSNSGSMMSNSTMTNAM